MEFVFSQVHVFSLNGFTFLPTIESFFPLTGLHKLILFTFNM